MKNETAEELEDSLMRAPDRPAQALAPVRAVDWGKPSPNLPSVLWTSRSGRRMTLRGIALLIEHGYAQAVDGRSVIWVVTYGSGGQPVPRLVDIGPAPEGIVRLPTSAPPTPAPGDVYVVGVTQECDKRRESAGRLAAALIDELAADLDEQEAAANHLALPAPTEEERK